MTANITKRADGFVEMAYVGEKPWHRSGQEVTKGASIEVWEEQAGFNWQALRARVEYKNDDGLLLPYEGNQVIYRSDNMQPLGLVSDKYQIVQPKQMLGMFRKMIEEAGWYIHTAGTLRGGARLWVMATHDKLTGSVGKADTIKCNMLGATSLDGSLRTVFKAVSERVVCENTLRIALAENGEEVSMNHRSEFDAEDLQDSLDVAAVSFEQFVEHANALAEQMIGVDDAIEILRTLFGQPTTKEIKPLHADYEFQRLMSQVQGTAGKLREQRSVTRCVQLFEGEGAGSQLPGSVGTAWGLLNAVTQHVDHELGRTSDGRLDSAWFGRGEIIKGSALSLVSA